MPARLPLAFKRDRRNDAALVATGHRVLRFSYEGLVFDGATVVQRLRGAAAHAA
jgi:very-short-patch-repair endonuclease